MYTLEKNLEEIIEFTFNYYKIFCPKSEEADFSNWKEKFKNIINQKSKGIHVYGGSKIENEN